MSKLYFRYGTVGSAKTLNLLAVAHNYELQNKKVFLIKPAIDTRFGEKVIKSRAGLEKEANLLISENKELDFSLFKDIDCILVDEAQFLPSEIIDDLRRITIELNIPVICYGLRTDFKTNFFSGSKRLMEIADSIEEIKTTCFFCSKKAIINMKLVNGEPTLDGPQVELGCEEKYIPVCAKCAFERLGDQIG
jgi:thymidine kinase